MSHLNCSSYNVHLFEVVIAFKTNYTQDDTCPLSYLSLFYKKSRPPTKKVIRLQQKKKKSSVLRLQIKSHTTIK